MTNSDIIKIEIEKELHNLLKTTDSFSSLLYSVSGPQVSARSECHFEQDILPFFAAFAAYIDRA
ncbi:hypothetical protein TYRP_012600 [Tyrophagus putrescentiae]|nr:hypothetical protein TYRP_012600 [Tyrophagus putrescentiae]